MGNAEGGRERRCRTGAGERNQVDITTAGAIMGEGNGVPGPGFQVPSPDGAVWQRLVEDQRQRHGERQIRVDLAGIREKSV